MPLFADDGARAGTVRVDGELRATWKFDIAGDIATLAVIATPKLSRQEASEVRAEGLRLLGFLSPQAPGEVVVNAVE